MSLRVGAPDLDADKLLDAERTLLKLALTLGDSEGLATAECEGAAVEDGRADVLGLDVAHDDAALLEDARSERDADAHAPLECERADERLADAHAESVCDA